MQQHHIDVGLLELEARGNVLERVAQAEHVETVGVLGVRSISVVRVEEEADLFGCVSAARCRPKSARGRCRGHRVGRAGNNRRSGTHSAGYGSGAADQ